jgi:hypothetical protein
VKVRLSGHTPSVQGLAAVAAMAVGAATIVTAAAPATNSGVM